MSLNRPPICEIKLHKYAEKNKRTQTCTSLKNIALSFYSGRCFCADDRLKSPHYYKKIKDTQKGVFNFGADEGT